MDFSAEVEKLKITLEVKRCIVNMKIILVDDHVLIRKGLAALLAKETDMDVAGEAESIEDAVTMIRVEKPDVVILNNRIGNCNGLEVVEKVGDSGIKCRFILLAAVYEEQVFKHVCQRKVDGYILKSVLPEELLYAIRLVHRGRKYYDPAIMECMVHEGISPVQGLTPRELQVLVALGQGMNNSLIASKLYITEFTVKKHISQILSKLRLRDRTEAALYANSKGLVEYK